MYVAISSDGQMSGAEMLKELQEARICPVMTYVENEERIVPLFVSADTAQKFAKRNTSRGDTIGTMFVREEDKQQLIDRGLKIEVLSFPKKRDIVVEVIHLAREVQTHNRGLRKDIK